MYHISEVLAFLYIDQISRAFVNISVIASFYKRTPPPPVQCFKSSRVPMMPKPMPFDGLGAFWSAERLNEPSPQPRSISGGSPCCHKYFQKPPDNSSVLFTKASLYPVREEDYPHDCSAERRYRGRYASAPAKTHPDASLTTRNRTRISSMNVLVAMNRGVIDRARVVRLNERRRSCSGSVSRR